MYRFFVAGLLLFIGLCTGSTVTAWIMSRPAPMQIVPGISNEETVVRINGIRNGALVGSVTGSGRVVAGGNVIIPDASGSFIIRDSHILTNVITVTAPPGMHFVASKKGKKYYSLTSAQGQQIFPQNRVYFPDAASAERAGYRP